MRKKVNRNEKKEKRINKGRKKRKALKEFLGWSSRVQKPRRRAKLSLLQPCTLYIFHIITCMEICFFGMIFAREERKEGNEKKEKEKKGGVQNFSENDKQVHGFWILRCCAWELGMLEGVFGRVRGR